MSIEIASYHLKSSHDIAQIINEISKTPYQNVLIHICSYMLNTVMVHNLSTELKRLFNEPMIVLIHGKKEDDTRVILYGYDEAFKIYIDDNGLSIENAALCQTHDQMQIAQVSLTSSKQELIKRYFTDHLTGLSNMYQLRQDLEDHCDQTLIMLSIDNFKIINDFYSFIVGDFLLEKVSKTLRSHIGDATLYRLSGSEFAIALKSSLDFYNLKEYLNRLYESLKHLSYEYHETMIYLDITMGSITSSTYEEIFSKVSMALQYAQSNHLPFWIYEDSKNLKLSYENNLKTSLNIRNAILNSKIVPYFQPIMDNKSNTIVAYECLARLIDSNNTVLAPDDFMNIAKKIKVYDEVTRTIIDKSFKVFKDNTMNFTINLSMDDILSSEINTFILEKLKSDDTGKRVTFELIESDNLIDHHKVNRFINEVKRYGGKIAIDNFGSSFSNFSLLASIDIDYIKIDGSLIERIDQDKNARIVVETIVSFAKRLHIQTIAEYVHTSTILGIVKEIGIEFSQGFEIDRPSPTIDQA